MKLNPPVIEGVIPAFTGTEITIPFAMNRSVSELEIGGFALMIKTVQSNYLYGVVRTTNKNTWDITKGVVTFDLSNLGTPLTVGQFYKIQLAYINTLNEAEIGYYSTVGIVKCSAEPVLEIVNRDGSMEFTGHYSQIKKDTTEKVYSYEFILKDNNQQIVERSGILLHNSANDTAVDESIDNYTIKTDLIKNKIYYLSYSVNTINGLQKTAPLYKIYKSDSIDSKLDAAIDVKLEYEDGYIDVNLNCRSAAVGKFILLRASSENNFNTWDEVLKFILYGQKLSKNIYKDMTIQQGIKYKYAVQQYNDYGLKTNKIESDIIAADFEHAFLFDGERQLKIKYNPKVTSFKNVLLETKVDTIGSKHPFIFRNGNVKYKEFPISGLISYLSDENNLFYNANDDDFYRESTESEKTFVVFDELITETVYDRNKYNYYYNNNGEQIPWITYVKQWNEEHPIDRKDFNNWMDMDAFINERRRRKKIYQEKDFEDMFMRGADLTSKNIYLERQFKLDALEWLTNGKPKIFRSPVEGNYLVRLLNVSLAPNDTLGRMIHTFSCTAYEIADCAYDTLKAYDIFRVSDPSVEQLRWQSTILSEIVDDNQDLLKGKTAVSIRLEGMIPGDQIMFNLTMEDGAQVSRVIVIGATGSYNIELKNNVKINNLRLVETADSSVSEDRKARHQGMLTYAFYSTDYKDSFDSVNAIKTNQVACHQFIGEHSILDEINDIKNQIESIGYLRFYLRNAEVEIYRQGSVFYSDKACVNEIDPVELIDIYKLHDSNLENGYTWYDGYNDKELGANSNPEFTQIKIYYGEEEDNYEIINIEDTFEYTVKNPQNIIGIETGAAIITEMCYQKKVINYDLESPRHMTQDMKFAKNEYDLKKTQLNTLINNENTKRKDLKACQDQCRIAYEAYCNALTLAIQEAERS